MADKTGTVQWSYQPAEDNEIELVEGDEITNIEMIAEGWAMGRTSRGDTGLFPANYVELIAGPDRPLSTTDGVQEPGSGELHIPPAQGRHLPVAVLARHKATLRPDIAAIVLCNNQKARHDDLELRIGDQITEINMVEEERWWGKNPRGERGLFSATHVQLPPFFGPIPPGVDGSTDPNSIEFDVPFGYELRRTSTGYLPRLMPKTEDHEGQECKRGISSTADDSAPTIALHNEKNAEKSILPLQESLESTAHHRLTGLLSPDGSDELYEDILVPGADFRMSVTAMETLNQLSGLRVQNLENESKIRHSKSTSEGIDGTIKYPAFFEDPPSRVDNRGPNPMSQPAHIPADILAILEDPDFRVSNLKEFYSSGVDVPATASFYSLDNVRSQSLLDERELIHFVQGLLIVESLDVQWIKALANIGVPVTFLMEHILRGGVDKFSLAAKVDALRLAEDGADHLKGSKSVHWDASFNTNCRAIQVLRQIRKFSSKAANNRDYGFNYSCLPDDTRLSFCQIGGKRYIALLDRPIHRFPASPFRKEMPILSPYIFEDGEETHSFKRTLSEFFRNSGRGSKIDDLFDDKLAVWWDMAAATFQHNLTSLSRDLNYFTFEAVNQPSISNFQTLNRDRKQVDEVLQYLNVCVGHTTEIQTLVSNPDRRTKGEIKIGELQRQAFEMKQDFNDTFQLLIGVLSILDSDVSKRQARRSTALTVLAAIYLPISLATGIFGMNIKEINQGVPKSWAVVTVGIGLLVITAIVVFFILRDTTGSGKRSTSGAEVMNVNQLERGFSSRI